MLNIRTLNAVWVQVLASYPDELHARVFFLRLLIRHSIETADQLSRSVSVCRLDRKNNITIGAIGTRGMAPSKFALN